MPDIFTANSAPLAEFLADIHNHKIALPNFQRPWVWEPEMVRQLILSVAYRYPAGSLLTMPIQTAGFALRPFEGAGRAFTQTPHRMVLDGQQRLTSLYQALYRLDGVTVKGRTYQFYLDVTALMAGDPTAGHDEDLFERSIFYVLHQKDGRRIRYEGTPPVPRYELTANSDELAAGALPLGCLFDADGRLAEWKNSYLVPLANNDMTQYVTLGKQWDTQIKPWLDRIRQYRFPVVELHADVPLSAICHIFEKVNSTGVPLDVFDLCTAILWTQGFHLNEAWAKTEKGLKPDLPMQPLTGTAFLQGLALLDTCSRKQAALGKPGPKVSVACRKVELMALSKTTVEAWWDVLIDGYKEAAKFMTQESILSERVLSYSTLIVPLAAIFAYTIHTKGPAHVGAVWPKVRRWYWCSVFSQRYSSQTESLSALDFEQVLSWIGGGQEPDVVRTFTFRSDSLEEIKTLRNVIYKGVLCLLAGSGAKDFGGGGTLSVQLFSDTRQDHHHIFPTAALQNLGINDHRADTIVNKTLINAFVNRSIGGQKPSAYIQSLRTKLDPQNPAHFDNILATHMIDVKALVNDNWNAFRLDRREQLRQLIEQVCGGNVQPFTVGAAVSLQLDQDNDDDESDDESS